MTEKYDPEKHGDGYSVMVPMNVEPLDASSVQVWLDGRPHVQWNYHDGDWPNVLSCCEGKADGWTLAPAKPGSPKSYAEYLVDCNAFDIDELAYCRDYEGQLVTFDLDLSTDRKRVRAKALIEAIQDALNHQNEAG